MRSRLLAIAAALALSLTGVLVAASPASAGCGGHGTHPDRYSGGNISFGDGTSIRTHPHTGCTRVGLGYPNHGIDVHCFVLNEDGVPWVYLRDTTTDVSGWSRYDALRYSDDVVIPSCLSGAAPSLTAGA